MNQFRKVSILKLSIVIFVLLIVGPLGTAAVAANEESNPLEDLLPKYNDYKWTYHGFVEYGHEMTISSIVKKEKEVQYEIHGKVYDASGGESEQDYSLSINYIVKPDVIVQIKNEEMMLDSVYDRIELIRGPLKEGTTWTQEVENEETHTTLKCTIMKVEYDGHEKVYTVQYEDVNSSYYEKRKIKENTGVISFERLMISDHGNYEVTYSIYGQATGTNVENRFTDVSMDEWYMDYVPPLVSLSIIEGYSNNEFKPHSHITVAEFIKLTLHSLSYTHESGSELWYTPHVEQAIALNLITRDEYSDYNRPITREEMTKIMVKAFEENPTTGKPEFSDTAEINEEYMPYVKTAVDLGIIEGYPSDNSFRPKEYTTRAEASKLSHLLVQKIDMEPFNAQSALSLEDEFENRLYQETAEDSWRVIDFDNKEDLIEHIMEVLNNRTLVEQYVNRFYKQEEDGLYSIPMDGLNRINEQKPYQLMIHHPREYQLVQEGTSAMRGDFKLIVTYQYDHQKWVMKNRESIIYE